METGCLFKDLFIGIQWVIHSSWFLTCNYWYLAVIRLFNKRLVAQEQEKKRVGGENSLVFLLDTSASPWFINLFVLAMISSNVLCKSD